MGLENSAPYRKTYLNIFNGKFAIKSTPGTQGAVMRINKEQKETWEIFFDRLSSAKIIGMNIDPSPYGEVLIVTTESKNVTSGEMDRFVVQMPLDSRYFSSFCNKLPNINFEKEYSFVPYSFLSKTERNRKGEAKRIAGINLYEGKEKIKNFFTKENPGDKPQLQENYDDLDLKIFLASQVRFFKNLVEAQASRFASAVTETSDHAESEAVSAEEAVVDDLPF